MNGKDLHFSKRKMRKFRYNCQRYLGSRERTYLSKSELVGIIEKAFYPFGLILPRNHYLKKTHRQLMNLIFNTANMIKKHREEASIWDAKLLEEMFIPISMPVGFAGPAIEDLERCFSVAVPDCGDHEFGIPVPDCGDRNGVVINNGGFTPI